MEAQIGSLLDVVLRVSLVLIAPIIVPAVLLSGPFLALWLGSASGDAVRLMQLLWIAYAIAAVCAPATHVITGAGRSRVAAMFAWATAILLLAILYMLVPTLGLFGAGIANLVAMSLGLPFVMVVRRYIKAPPDPTLKRLFFGIAAGCLAQLAFHSLLMQPVQSSWQTFFLVGAGSLAIHQMVRWSLGTLSAEERRLIKSMCVRFR